MVWYQLGSQTRIVVDYQDDVTRTTSRSMIDDRTLRSCSFSRLVMEKRHSTMLLQHLATSHVTERLRRLREASHAPVTPGIVVELDSRKRFVEASRFREQVRAFLERGFASRLEIRERNVREFSTRIVVNGFLDLRERDVSEFNDRTWPLCATSRNRK